MKTTKPRSFPALFFAALAACVLNSTLVLSAAAAPAAAPATAARKPLTLAMRISMNVAPVLIAEDQGYFAAEGLPLTITRCAVGRICLQQLLEGQAHFATVAETPIALVALERKDFSIIATTTSSGSELRMVTRNDGGIASPADLKGKRIGFIKSTSSHYYLETFLLFNGLKTADIVLVPLDATTAAAALVRSDVDAASLFEPAASDAIEQLGGAGRVLTSPRFFTLYFNLVSAGRRAGVTLDDEVRLLRAVRRGEAFIRSEPERARNILAGMLKLPPAKVADVWGQFDYRLQLSQPLIVALESQARWALREGLVPADARMPNFLELIDTEPLHRVDPRSMRLVR